MSSHSPTASGSPGPCSDPETSAAIRVLVVDDQDLVRAGFGTILDNEVDIVVVGEASDGAGAIRAARDLRPDVICMDVQMPGMDGLAATRAIVDDSDVTAAVLVLTTFDREDYLFGALAAGASGFLLKNASPERLIDAVRVLAAGDALLSPDVTRRVIARYRTELDPGVGQAPDAASAAAPVAADSESSVQTPVATPTSMPASAPTPAFAAAPTSMPALLENLTSREREVLVLLAEGLANAEIATRLFVGEATVKSHVSQVLRKLSVRDRIHAVVFAYRHGIVDG